jgi:APA family basic amino acid/polyamine antiporter
VAIKVGALAGLTSVILVLMYGQTRVFYTMARDGLLPSPFSAVHSKFKTPYINTLVTGVIVAVGAGVFDINTIGDLTSVGTLAAFAIVCVSVIWLRQARPDLERGFKVPLYPVVPVVGILSCIYLIFQTPPNVQLFFAWFMGGAIVLYFVYGIWNSKLAKGIVVKGHEPPPQDFETPQPRNPQG